MNSIVTYQKANKSIVSFVISMLVCCNIAVFAQKPGAVYITSRGYDSCVQIANATAMVLLEPNAGGRILLYAMNGVNVLYEDGLQDGWMATPEIPRTATHICGGRFDIGPSRIKPNTDLFFFGKWKSQITGKFSARLTSQVDSSLQIYLVRDFVLDETTSHLRCKQTIVNIGNKNFSGALWSRTLAKGNGICVMPVDSINRFPKSYIMFMNRDSINVMPVDSNIAVKNNFLVIKGPPQKPKLEMNVASPGWIAYAEMNNLLFVKKFTVYSNKQYGDITAANTSIWYNGTQMTEIEPISPWQLIAPGKRYSFTEDWYILPFDFPRTRAIDLKKLDTLVHQIK